MRRNQPLATEVMAIRALQQEDEKGMGFLACLFLAQQERIVSLEKQVEALHDELWGLSREFASLHTLTCHLGLAHADLRDRMSALEGKHDHTL